MQAGARFDGKVVVVTGASAGMGLAAAELLGSDGAKVVAVARNEDKLAEAKKAITAAGKSTQQLYSPMPCIYCMTVRSAVHLHRGTFGDFLFWQVHLYSSFMNGAHLFESHLSRSKCRCARSVDCVSRCQHRGGKQGNDRGSSRRVWRDPCSICKRRCGLLLKRRPEPSCA